MALSLSRLTLSQRISTIFALTVVFSIGLSAYFFVAFQELGLVSRNEARIAAATQAAYQLRIEAQRAMLLLYRYEETGDAANLAALDVTREQITEAQRRLRKFARLPEVIEDLNRYAALQPERDAATAALLAAINARAARVELAQARKRRNAIDDDARSLLWRIIALEESALGEASARLQQLQERLSRNAIGLMLAHAMLLTGLLYSLIAGGLTRRLSQLTVMARQIAAGDYSQREFERNPDEVGVLATTFNDMARQLAAFDKVKEEFVALASHQLRTPATAVKGNLGMLLEGYCGEITAEQREVLRDANDSNERQLAVIEDMLWVARTDSGRLALTKAPADLAKLVDAVVTEQTHVVTERRQTVRLEKPDGPLVAIVDAQKIRMVFENLLSNASKYTPEGGRVSVRLRELDGSAVLSIKDNGVGIAPEDVGKLFSKFSRIANPLSEKVGGTGLGLFLANEIVKLHGGTIQVESQPGAGTTFTVTVPKDRGANGKSTGG